MSSLLTLELSHTVGCPCSWPLTSSLPPLPSPTRTWCSAWSLSSWSWSGKATSSSSLTRLSCAASWPTSWIKAQVPFEGRNGGGGKHIPRDPGGSRMLDYWLSLSSTHRVHSSGSSEELPAAIGQSLLPSVCCHKSWQWRLADLMLPDLPKGPASS